MMLTYVATPYTNYPDGIYLAWLHACKAAAKLVMRGTPVYCPIAHTHPLAIHGNIDPLDWELWMRCDKPMMDASTDLAVIMMPSWDKSKGVLAEIDAFELARKPIIYYIWPDIVMDRAFTERTDALGVK